MKGISCLLRISSDSLSSVLSTTLDSVLRVVLTFRVPRFRPSMSLALNMSAFVMGKFGKRPLST